MGTSLTADYGRARVAGPTGSEALRQSGKNGPPRAELRRSDPDPGTVADLVFLVEQIDHVEAQLEALEQAGIHLLQDAQIDLLIIRQMGAVRAVDAGAQAAAIQQIRRE